MRFTNLIDGEGVASSTGNWMPAIDPSTGRQWAEVPRSDATDIDRAVDAAVRAFDADSWSGIADMDRARLLRRLASLLERDAEALAAIEVRDNGRSVREVKGSFIPGAIETLYYYAGLADKVHGETVRVSPASFNFTLREPLGVVGVIVPYNAPLTVLIAKAAPALAAGNTVVVKPSEHAAASCLQFGSLFAEAGFPPGVVNIVSGLGTATGAPLVRHPDVRKLAMTGSVSTARQVSIDAAPGLKQLQFELGGKSPHVIFADADLEAAVHEAVVGIFTGSAGQSCGAGSRIIIERRAYDDVLAALLAEANQLQVGDPFDPDTDLGPVSFAGQLEHVRKLIDAGKVDTELLAGGGFAEEMFPEGSPLRGGYFVQPTIFATEDPDVTICQEEVFGPVAVVLPFDDDAEALRLANNTRYGLASGVWTSDLDRALRFVHGIKAGAVWVNAYRRNHWALPFGGYKESGYGRDSGVDALAEYQQSKSVWIEQR